MYIIKEDTAMDYEKLEKSAKAKGIVRNVVIYTLLILWAVMVLFPFTG